MVGHFGPLVQAIRKQAKALYIFEQIDLPQDNLLPVSEAEHLLPQCQVALLTSTAIINQTADHLLALAVGCREIVFLGASPPYPGGFRRNRGDPAFGCHRPRARGDSSDCQRGRRHALLQIFH